MSGAPGPDETTGFEDSRRAQDYDYGAGTTSKLNRHDKPWRRSTESTPQRRFSLFFGVHGGNFVEIPEQTMRILFLSRFVSSTLVRSSSFLNLRGRSLRGFCGLSEILSRLHARDRDSADVSLEH